MHEKFTILTYLTLCYDTLGHIVFVTTKMNDNSHDHNDILWYSIKYIDSLGTVTRPSNM